MARAVVVDENDNVTGYKERADWLETDIIRVAGLWITNSKGEILLAQRSLNKKHDAGKWGEAAGGTVEEGETYESNILKEAQEEIGLTDIKLIAGPKRLIQGAYRRIFLQSYSIVVDKSISDFKVEPMEIEKLRWFTPEELKAEWRSNPEKFSKVFSTYIEFFLK